VRYRARVFMKRTELQGDLLISNTCSFSADDLVAILISSMRLKLEGKIPALERRECTFLTSNLGDQPPRGAGRSCLSPTSRHSWQRIFEKHFP
jgi:hypothetical protein